jgi:methionyl-tRNA synthetase
MSDPVPTPPPALPEHMPRPAAPDSPGSPPPATASAGAPPPAPVPEGVALISIDDFFKIKLATAEVFSVVPHPKADRLLILQVKVGDETKQIVSGIRQYYTPEQLVGRTIIVVNNLLPTKLRGEMSNGMLLAVTLPEGGLRLLTTDGPAPSGIQVK